MTTPASLRRQQAALARLAAADLAAMWAQVSNAVEARVALEDILPALIRTYGEAAAAIAADWYDDARLAAGMGGSFRAIPAFMGEQGVSALALWATSHGTDLVSIAALVNGGVQRRIANWGRDTITRSSLADPRADGWQRAGVGECDWCTMLISRGAVYSESTVDFSAHDDCNCVAVPAFKGEPRPVKPYTPSIRKSEADQARAKKWIADNL